MSEPIIAGNSPIPVQLSAGDENHWCACGRSQNQPFCDGSHVGTEFTPVAFAADSDGEAYLCVCKRTGTPPYCDGSHAQFGDELIGTDGSAAPTAPETPVAVGDSGGPAARPTPEEPTVAFIHELARDGLAKLGHHGPDDVNGCAPRRPSPLGRPPDHGRADGHPTAAR